MAKKSHLDLMSSDDLVVDVKTTSGVFYKNCNTVTSQLNPQVFHFWDEDYLVSIPYVNIASITHYKNQLKKFPKI